MQPYKEIQLRYVCPCGNRITFWVVSPVAVLTGEEPGGTGEKSLPRFEIASPPLEGTGDRGKPGPPVSPADAGDAGFPGPLSRDGTLFGADRVRVATTAEELKEAREALAFWSNEVAALDEMLGPAKDVERQIRAAIIKTHGRREDFDGVKHGKLLDLSRADERKARFAALDQWVAEWGPMRAERSTMAVEMRIQQRHVKKLEDRLRRESERRTRK